MQTKQVKKCVVCDVNWDKCKSCATLWHCGVCADVAKCIFILAQKWMWYTSVRVTNDIKIGVTYNVNEQVLHNVWIYVINEMSKNIIHTAMQSCPQLPKLIAVFVGHLLNDGHPTTEETIVCYTRVLKESLQTIACKVAMRVAQKMHIIDTIVEFGIDVLGNPSDALEFLSVQKHVKAILSGRALHQSL